MSIFLREGDERTVHRLLTLLKNKLAVYHLQQIRKNVFFLHTCQGKFILKGYVSRQKLRLQEDFTIALHQNGFRQTPLFKKMQPIFINPYFYGWQSYIEPSFLTFHYRHERDRKEGLHLLSAYHRRTKRLIRKFEQRLPNFDLLTKWHKRLQQFKFNSQQLQYCFPIDYLHELIHWGEWALSGMKQNQMEARSENKVIIHGDVAHHNFIRAHSRDLYLIDFDLIHIGDRVADIVQYTNRILPFIHWSFQKLKTYREINPYLENKMFLFALTYPTDIYREWNRWVSRGMQSNEKRINRLLYATFNQFSLRQQFMIEMKNMLN